MKLVCADYSTDPDMTWILCTDLFFARGTKKLAGTAIYESSCVLIHADMSKMNKHTPSDMVATVKPHVVITIDY